MNLHRLSVLATYQALLTRIATANSRRLLHLRFSTLVRTLRRDALYGARVKGAAVLLLIKGIEWKPQVRTNA